MARAPEDTGGSGQEEEDDLNSLGKNKYEAGRTTREKVGESKDGEGRY